MATIHQVELQAPSLAYNRRRFTVTEFQRMGDAHIFSAQDRVELMDGVVVTMAAIGPMHVLVVNCLVRLLVRQLVDGTAIVSPQSPIILSDSSQPQPDLTVLRNRDGYATELPMAADAQLVIEVSDTTLAYDRGIRLPLYAGAGIPEAWEVFGASAG